MTDRQYLRAFCRTNLLEHGERWGARRARERAARVLDAFPAERYVLLGSRVAAAFGLPYAPFTVTTSYGREHLRHFLVLPHPSGRCRAWNDPRAASAARGAFERFAA